MHMYAQIVKSYGISDSKGKSIQIKSKEKLIL